MLEFLHKVGRPQLFVPQGFPVPRPFELVAAPLETAEWTLWEFADKWERDAAGHRHARAKLFVGVLHPDAHPHTIVSVSRDVLRRSLENTLPSRWVGSSGAGVEQQRTASAIYVRNFVERPAWVVQHADILARVTVCLRVWQAAYSRQRAESLVADLVAAFSTPRWAERAAGR
jgi:hypothetical protein